MTELNNRRILLIDDNPSIHEDFKKILAPEDSSSSEALTDMRAAFLGGGAAEEPSKSSQPEYELVSATQGEEGYDLLCKACDDGQPFALAFVDMRMPPGWDGVKTITKLWERDPDLQVVICTAFSDYTWGETIEILGSSDRLLILKKPFDAIEITMLASALVGKWNMAAHEKQLYQEAVRSEKEARAYAASLETVNRALVTSQAASEMALDFRTELLVQVSHEVNLCLTEVVSQMAGRCLDSDPDGNFEGVLDASTRMLGTLNEILDVTALEQGKCEIELSECSPSGVASDALKQFEEQANEKGLKLELSVEGHVPDQVLSESVRLQQVLYHLLDNAIRHTAEGSVRLVVKPGEVEDWQRPNLLFEVHDTGPGIPSERHGSVFEPFARGDQSEQGFGFGLSLARRLAVFLGGDLTVRSEPGQGSCFSFTLRYDHVGMESKTPTI